MGWDTKNTIHKCPKCGDKVDVHTAFEEFTSYSQTWCDEFDVYCHQCNHKFTVERCVSITYETG